MHEAENTKVVQDAYAAFGSGDIQRLLTHVDDNVIWHAVYGTGQQVPTGGERRGKPAVATFFGQVAEHISFSRFEPREFIATGDKVVALGHYAATTPGRKGFDSDFAMVFTLKNGKITNFQEFCDGTAITAAYPTAPPEPRSLMVRLKSL